MRKKNTTSKQILRLLKKGRFRLGSTSHMVYSEEFQVVIYNLESHYIILRYYTSLGGKTKRVSISNFNNKNILFSKDEETIALGIELLIKHIKENGFKMGTRQGGGAQNGYTIGTKWGRAGRGCTK